MWTNEAKFIANAYGLRNRMAILAETPGHESFERRIYAHYALIAGVLEFANAHGKEMQDVCRAADREVVDTIKAKAETGELRNFVAGKYESYGKVEVLAKPVKVSGEEFGVDKRSVVYPVYKYFKIFE